MRRRDELEKGAKASTSGHSEMVSYADAEGDPARRRDGTRRYVALVSPDECCGNGEPASSDSGGDKTVRPTPPPQDGGHTIPMPSPLPKRTRTGSRQSPPTDDGRNIQPPLIINTLAFTPTQDGQGAVSSDHTQTHGCRVPRV